MKDPESKNNVTPVIESVPPMPHLSGKKATPGSQSLGKQHRNWLGLLANSLALLVGSVFLLWACGLGFAMMTEEPTPGALSTSDITAMIIFWLLGVGSIAWLVRVFLFRKKNVGDQ